MYLCTRNHQAGASKLRATAVSCCSACLCWRRVSFRAPVCLLPPSPPRPPPSPPPPPRPRSFVQAPTVTLTAMSLPWPREKIKVCVPSYLRSKPSGTQAHKGDLSPHGRQWAVVRSTRNRCGARCSGTSTQRRLIPALKQGKCQLLHPATSCYPFPRGKFHTRGNIWFFTVG